MKPPRRGAAKKSASRKAAAKKTLSAPSKPRSKSGRDRAVTAAHTDPGTTAFIVAADSLFRCAVESCRQHHRLARLIAGAASDAEQLLAWRVAALCDTLLKQVTDGYAPIAAQSSSNSHAEERRCANAMWRASRAFTNRFLDKSRLGGDAKHSSGDFLDLRLQHELDASSILNLKQAADGYRRARPAATLAIADGKGENGN